MKANITGYWTFFCNPKFWAIDDFLINNSIGIQSQYRITTWQEKYFSKGQLGIVRVGCDLRTKSQLGTRMKLKKGVYAAVEILGPPAPQVRYQSSFQIDPTKDESSRLVVPIRYIKNYVHNPVLLDQLVNDPLISQDRYLLRGIQAASMPLQENAFDRILLYGEENLQSLTD